MLKLRHPCCVYCGAMFSDGALAGVGKLVPTVLDMYFKKKKINVFILIGG